MDILILAGRANRLRRPQWPTLASPRAAGAIVGALLLYGIGLLLFTGSGSAVLRAYIGQLTTLSGTLALILCAASRSWGLLRRDRTQSCVNRDAWLIVAVLVTGLALPLFGVFKQLVLPLRPFTWDTDLAQWDRMLFGGIAPWTLTHFVFGSMRATVFLDNLYSLWLLLMFTFPVVAVMVAPSQELRVRLLATWMLSWIVIASLGGWVFASAGPCFYNMVIGPNASFAALGERLAAIDAEAMLEGKAIGSLSFQTTLLEVYGASTYAPAGGISAMPSMHVAMATLFAIGGFKVGRALGIATTFYAVLIWIGSIHLGWHYASDGIVGALMMLALWKATGPAVRWLDITPTRSSPAASTYNRTPPGLCPALR